jgi:hypothetical protein
LNTNQAYFGFIFSSSFFFYLVAIIAIPLLLVSDKSSTFLQRVVSSAMLGIMFTGIGFSFIGFVV